MHPLVSDGISGFDDGFVALNHVGVGVFGRGTREVAVSSVTVLIFGLSTYRDLRGVDSSNFSQFLDDVKRSDCVGGRHD